MGPPGEGAPRKFVRPARVAMALAFLAAAPLLGWWAGVAIRRMSMHPSTGSPPPDSSGQLSWHDWYAQLDSSFRQEIKGIAVGTSFPEVPLWSADGQRALEIRELLPGGGTIVLVSPGCDRCLESAALLQGAVDSVGDRATPIILVMDSWDGAAGFLQGLAAHSVRLPVYCDATTALRTQHHVSGSLAYFALDSAGLVAAIGFLMNPTLTDMLSVVSENTPSADGGAGGRPALVERR